jgi:bifunctional non-homologous end joining protein LigD
LTNSNSSGSVRTQERFGKAQFHVFDILARRDDATLHLPYNARRQLLVDVIGDLRARYPDCQIILVPQLPSSAHSITQSLASGYEGVMIKSKHGPYEPGKRSKHWYKVKSFWSADAFICGYAPGMSGNAGQVGSLEVGVIRVDGSIRPVAKLGNLSAVFRSAISAADGSLRPDCYGMVVEFSAQGLTKSGRARHGSMMRIRPDKSADECLEDQLNGFPSV